ncbi:hypothetical protein AMELA_G00089790 [Ameiurus melas]|uniref:Secreted protein n=1 Tax=Ameiurus melas TaxID=219545 RepID=A0A7J6AVN5_AMEME|nr:hypothetical protein AMELA_G00089790 [Ameiurus melas]
MPQGSWLCVLAVLYRIRGITGIWQLCKQSVQTRAVTEDRIPPNTSPVKRSESLQTMAVAKETEERQKNWQW